jgi:hypothetical protein
MASNPLQDDDGAPESDVVHGPGEGDIERAPDPSPDPPGRTPGTNPDNPGDDPGVRRPGQLPDVIGGDDLPLPASLLGYLLPYLSPAGRYRSHS